MDIRIRAKGITTSCDNLEFIMSDINEEFIKNLPCFSSFKESTYEKHLKRGLWKAEFRDDNGWNRVIIYLYKSKKEMNNSYMNE